MKKEIIAILLLTILTNCSQLSKTQLESVSLPSPISYGDLKRPVADPNLKVGDNAFVGLLKYKQALNKANNRIIQSCDLDEQVAMIYDEKLKESRCIKTPN